MKMVSLALPLLLLLWVGFVYPLNVTFHPPNPTVLVDHLLEVQIVFQGSSDELRTVRDGNWSTSAEPPNVLGAEFSASSIQCYDQNTYCNGTVTLKGIFLGFGKVILQLPTQGFKLDVTVLRKDSILNHIFTAFVAIVVSINYINMGCALDLDVVKKVLKRPIGPAIGFVCQFVIMPMVAYGVGYLIFDDPVLHLGLFTFGSSPGGGASNMWTVLLEGNLNLSITMTFVSTIAALGTLPLWLFTLGKTILKGTEIVIPFSNIFYSLICLTIPILIGLLIQRRFPKVAARSKRILAPVCIILLIGIVVLASIANSYIFFMLSWRILVAASLSVCAGFVAGAVVGTLFRFPREDIVAVAVETGVQNSGIAFLLLAYSLKPPVSDMASVVPIAGSIITPFPLLLVYCCQKLRRRCGGKDLELNPINKKEAESQGEERGIENMAQKDVHY